MGNVATVCTTQSTLMSLFPGSSTHNHDTQQHPTEEECHKRHGHHGAAVLFILPPLSRRGLYVACFAVDMCGWFGTQHACDGLRERLWTLRGFGGERGVGVSVGVGVELDVVGLGDGCILASVCQFLSLQIRGFVRTHSRCRPRTREAVHGVVVEDIIVGGRCFLWALRDTHFFLCGWNYGKSWSKCMI